MERVTDTIQCLACRAQNDPAEERCTRCGKRLHLASPQAAPAGFVSRTSGASATAVAPALEAIPGGAPTITPAELPFVRQPSLFKDVLSGSKVIPIPTLTPLRAPGEMQPRRPGHRSGPRPSRRVSDTQQALQFYSPGQAPTVVREAIYCDAPVADPVQRLLAAALDGSLVAIGLGMFLVIFLLGGGDLVFDRQTVSLLTTVAIVITIFYRILWCLGGGDTPGMRWAGLRLVDFDGRRPGRDQRGVRQAASLLSLVSAGLGLVWALVDEENLTWHDHISKTFPTPQ